MKIKKVVIGITVLVVLGLAMNLLSQQKDIPNIAVNELNGQGIEQSEAVVVTEQLRVELLKSGKLQIIERSLMQEILDEQGFQQAGCVNDACAVEIGQLLGVKNILVGTLGAAGSYTILTVRILEVKSGVVISSETVKTKGGIDNLIEEGIREITGKILSGIFSEQPVKKEHQVQKDQPEKEEQPEKQSGKSGGPKRALLWGGIGAVVVGGGVTAVLLLNENNTDEDPGNQPNVKIDLP